MRTHIYDIFVLGLMFETLKLYVRNHSAQMAIVGIMVTVSAAIGVLATGDIGQAFAHARR